VTVQNVGTQNASIKVDVTSFRALAAIPGISARDRSDQALWFFSDGTGTTAPWSFRAYDPDHVGEQVEPVAGRGDSDTFYTRFVFPTSTSSMSDHYMSATISVVRQSVANVLDRFATTSEGLS